MTTGPSGRPLIATLFLRTTSIPAIVARRTEALSARGTPEQSSCRSSGRSRPRLAGDQHRRYATQVSFRAEHAQLSTTGGAAAGGLARNRKGIVGRAVLSALR